MEQEQATIQERLAAPMAYQWRVKTFYPKGKPGSLEPGTKGQFLAYIDARDVFNRLDEVVGLGKWETSWYVINEERQAVHGTITVEIDGDRIGKSDVGYPNGATDEEPLKSAVSDAIKRAAVQFGIGRFLYDMDPVWVEVDKWGKPLKPISTTSTSRQETTHPTTPADRDVNKRTGEILEDQPCEAPDCDGTCAGKFVDYSKRTYGFVLCAKHSAMAKKGELELDPRENARTRTADEEVKKTFPGAEDVDPDDIANLMEQSPLK